MKKLLVSLLAIAGLVACTNDQTLVQRGNAPMEFAGAFVDNATRANVGDAADPSTTTNSLEGFDVWAFMDEPAGTVFEDENVTRVKGNFSYVNTQYWVPGHTYYFAALAPMNSANWNLNTAAANTDGAGIVDFHNVDGTEDLLYAATSVSTQNMELGAAMDKVKFQFNHLLSKVKFSFTNGFPNANARIDVKNVKMVAPAFASINLAQADWWSTNQWVLVEGETTTLKFGDACDKTAPGVTQETANERLTIPAGATQSYIVTFDVALYYGDRLAFEKTGITTTIDGVALEIGKSYNFTANLNASNIAGDTKLTSIDFDVEEVKKWEEKTVSLIDSPEKLVKAIEGDEVDHIILDGNINLDDLLSTGTLSTRAGSSSASITIPAGKEVVLDLKDFTITGTDNDTASFGMFNIQPGAKLTIEGGNGKIQLTATKNRGWGAFSSVISNQRGEFVLNGGTIEHLGGTDMAYGIDNLTNTGADNAKVTINGGVVTTPYRAVRQFLNSTKALCEVVVNGGKIYSNGGNKAIWVQNANDKVNPGKLVVAADAEIGDVMVSGTGATELDIELSVAKAALMEGAQVTISSSNAPAGYEVVLENDVWTINYNPYYDHEKVANGLYKKDKTYVAINGEGLVALSGMTIKGGEIVTLGADIDLTGVEFNGLRAFNPETNNTFDGNNYTVSNWTYNGGANDMAFIKSWVGTIKNVNFDNCNLKTGGRSAVVAANTYCQIDNVHVSNSTLTSTWWACGMIAGLYNHGSVSNCTVTDCSISSTGGVGAIVGVFNETDGVRTITNCEVEGCAITCTNENESEPYYAGAAMVGLINLDYSTIKFINCKQSNNTYEGMFCKDELYGYSFSEVVIE